MHADYAHKDQPPEISLTSERINAAAAYLADAWKSGRKKDPLPADLKPRTIEESHAIQDATLTALNAAVGGWKVSFNKQGTITRAPILRSIMFSAPARVSASSASIGIESEIGFRVLRSLPARAEEYSRTEVADAVEALPIFELLDSRYADPDAATPLERTADFANNGGLVHGPALGGWRSIDFKALDVVLTIDGKEVCRKAGSYPGGDPLAPAVVLVNTLRRSDGIAVGQIITTGNWTGANLVGPSSLAVAQFGGGFAPVTCAFAA